MELYYKFKEYKEDGIEEGLEKGRKEGLAEGIKIGKAELEKEKQRADAAEAELARLKKQFGI